MTELSPKQQIFVTEYVKDFNGQKAAERCGYAASCARITASKLLTKTNIQEAIRTIVGEVRDKSIVDKAYVLDRAAEIEQLDPLDILEDNGALKPLSEWPKPFRTAITGFDIDETYENDGDGGKRLTGYIKRVKWVDKHKILEMIGKHDQIAAFKPDNQTITNVNFPSTIEIVAGDGS